MDEKNKNKLLIVEDDREISEMLGSFLETEQYEIDRAYDGEEAIYQFQTQSYALILLDLMIPKMSGIDVLKQIRKTSNVPVLILSAKDSDSDKTYGLGIGADDYIIKPFSVTEVLARIKANIRRSTIYAANMSSQQNIQNMQNTQNMQNQPNWQPQQPQQNSQALNVQDGNRTMEMGQSFETQKILSHGDLVIRQEEHAIFKNNQKVELTVTEYEILNLLMEHPTRVYTKEQLYHQIWKEDYFGDENAVNVHISRLRSKIEEEPRKPKYIITVWGIGYKLGKI